MSYVKDINVKITGQVSGEGNDYDKAMAHLKMVCADFDLDLEDAAYNNRWEKETLKEEAEEKFSKMLDHLMLPSSLDTIIDGKTEGITYRQWAIGRFQDILEEYDPED